jgi:hypothetical protein
MRQPRRIYTMLQGLGTALAMYALCSAATGDEPTFPLGIDVAGMDQSVAPEASFLAPSDRVRIW